MPELDPNGIDQHAPGAKLDAGKPKVYFMLSQFFSALAEVNKVSMYGANKYTVNGWRDVPDGEERYAEALLRHLAAHKDGELRDKDTGLLHVAHMAWNGLAVLWFVVRNISQSTQKAEDEQKQSKEQQLERRIDLTQVCRSAY